MRRPATLRLWPSRALRVTAAWRRIPPLRQDILLACAVAVFALVVSVADGWSRGRSIVITDVGEAARWVVPILAICAPLAVRRRFPLGAVAATGAMVLVMGAASEVDDAMWVVGLAVASAAYHRHRLRTVLLVVSIGWAVVLGVGEGAPGVVTMLVYAAAGATPVAVGYALRLRAERAVQAIRLQRAREERARSQEAARIARDVHDIVGHHLSAIRLQAVGARRSLAGRDSEAEEALSGIADLSGEALAEIRAWLATLVPSDTGETQQRGLADLAALAERSGGTELTVALHMEPGLEGIVHSEVEACVYRVIQEALTNVAKHSTAKAATVKVRSRGGGLSVTVDDPGRQHKPYAGAVGFLLKDGDPDLYLAAIRAAHRGQGLIDPQVTRRLVRRFAAPPVRIGEEELTVREVEVLRLLALGWSNAEIGESLRITAGTVKTHVSHIFGKIGARTRVQAAIHAYRSGLVPVEDR
ncbi:helix-turn-helix transcriptional regulator [Sinosporangium siamense]|nr:response regulator transcription factor family protein [Sinosporangium siamense]